MQKEKRQGVYFHHAETQGLRVRHGNQPRQTPPPPFPPRRDSTNPELPTRDLRDDCHPTVTPTYCSSPVSKVLGSERPAQLKVLPLLIPFRTSQPRQAPPYPYHYQLLLLVGIYPEPSVCPSLSHWLLPVVCNLRIALPASYSQLFRQLIIESSSREGSSLGYTQGDASMRRGEGECMHFTHATYGGCCSCSAEINPLSLCNGHTTHVMKDLQGQCWELVGDAYDVIGRNGSCN